MFKLKERFIPGDHWFTARSVDGSKLITFRSKMSLEKVLKNGCQGLKCGRVNAQLWVYNPRRLITNDEQVKQHREELLMIMTREESYTEAMKEDNRKAELRVLEAQAKAEEAQANAKKAEAKAKIAEAQANVEIAKEQANVKKAEAQANVEIAKENATVKVNFIGFLKSAIENPHCDEEKFREATTTIIQLSITSGLDNETMQSTL